MSQDSLTEIGVESPVAEEAARLASLAQANGIDGIVCSPMDAGISEDPSIRAMTMSCLLYTSRCV